MFMSDTRLVLHNIPKSYSQDKIKDLIYQSVNDAKDTTENIKKARLGKVHVTLMKDRKGDSGKSLGYSFIKLETPEAALLVLRSMNNHPSIFTNEKRPVVEFCCENRKALEIQKRRQEKGFQKTQLNEKITSKKPKVKAKIDVEEGKLFKYQGMPAQKRKKGEKLTIPSENFSKKVTIRFYENLKFF